MAVRLACPECGAAFTLKPADAGRVVPCKRCGSDLQMPDAAPPAAKVVPHRRRDEGDEDERPRPAPARGPLLLLLTFLAAGLTGLFLGAGVFFVAFRERPAAPVAQKPADPPPAVAPQVVPPTVPPPTPQPEVPKAVPQPPAPPVGPKPAPPRVPGLPVATGAVAADTLPGLKFYLACDRFDDGRPVETVSGKPVGTAFGLAVTDGPRGSAIRLTHDRKDANRFALDLSDAKEQFAIPTDRPFTLSVWARRVHTDAAGGFGAFLLDANSEPDQQHSRFFHVQLLPTTPALVAVKVLDTARPLNIDNGFVQPKFRVADPTAWSHYVVTRDDRGHGRLLINGTESPSALPQLIPGELRFDRIGLLRSAEGKTVIDLDELCLFDRALTPDEVAALGGRKGAAAVAPNPPAAEAKRPPDGAVIDATAIKGLKFYLPCDAIDNGTLLDAVSGKAVGRGQRLETVPGPRGKGVRTTAGGLGAAREAFVLNDSADALTVAEGKPFTLTMWVRAENWETVGGSFVYAAGGKPELFRSLTLYRFAKGVGFLLQQGRPGDGAGADAQLARATLEMAPTKDWFHLALVRDDRGSVRVVVNGEAEAVAKGSFTAELKFATFVLIWQQGQPFTAEFDEFALFDRALTNNELARLAGRKGDAVAAAPKDPPMPAEPKEPPKAEPKVEPKGPLQVAPPPRAVVAAVEPPAVAASAPAGVDPKGLLLYLHFDEQKDGQLREGVTGKFAGKCDGVELVKGQRNSAARLAARADGELAPRLDFSDLAERTTVAAGKPFALALWLRVEPREAGTKVSGTAVQFGVRPDRAYDRSLQVGFGSAGTLHCTARSTPDRLDGKRETAARWVGLGTSARWQHLAMVRDEKNAVRWYVNGKPAPQPGKGDPVWDGPLGFDRVVVGDPEQAKAILEVDELCLFDRVLTPEELKRLSEPPK
jgi:outer membrane biosynthesis protein TonB